ncbi:MAG: NAD(P)H-dependent glycerol-3-phosphate dehydrogenase [Parcubacteria group bacterium LiPW_15]|nr:MAG: NAD(P)H-dependent glycerol-3-phosphate dehydrogenase [Parcubacteria group bacterium LiPW_15]
MRVLIIGAGEIGLAIGTVLQNAGHEVWFWDRNSSKCTKGKDLKDAAADCDCVFFCVPSTGLRDAAINIAPVIPANKPIVVLSKGIESGSNKTSDAVLEDIFPKNSIAVLGGPMLAEEMKRGEAAIGVLGVEDDKTSAFVISLFNGTRLYIERTTDIRGLALCGALKNIYSLSFGFAEASGEESNVKGSLSAQSLREMVEIVTVLGGRPETVMGPGGLGDLVASGMSVYGYNRRVGRELLEKGKTDLVSEGILSIGPIGSLLGEKCKEYKLFSVIQKIIFSPGEGRRVFEEYLQEQY